MDSSSTWTTSDEIAYLRGIGSHTLKKASEVERQSLLKAYLKCMDYRWNSAEYLNFGLIRKWVIGMISNEQEEVS